MEGESTASEAGCPFTLTSQKPMDATCRKCERNQLSKGLPRSEQLLRGRTIRTRTFRFLVSLNNHKAS
jgi:hypothetical protein